MSQLDREPYRPGTYELIVLTSEEMAERGKLARIITEHPDAEVIFVDDDHRNDSIRKKLYAEAKSLKKSGITSLALEGSTDHRILLSSLGKGKSVNLYGIAGLAPMSFGDRSYADAIYAMSDAEVSIFPIDSPQNFNGHGISPEERESCLDEQLKIKPTRE